MLENEHYGSLLVGANAFRSRGKFKRGCKAFGVCSDDELSRSTAESADIIFVVYTFILLVSYTTLVHFNCDAYRSKSLCSLAGSLACVMGLATGFGVASLLGISFVPTALVAPFLVMGVGADDIFVLVSSYALTYGESSARQRCAATLGSSGVSLVMTTFTNVVAFAIGIQSPYLSIKNFCIFTLSGLFFSLVYELTLFFAFLCLDARREEQSRASYCGIVIHHDLKEEEEPPFHLRNLVSTYQVVHVLVAEALMDKQGFEIIPWCTSSHSSLPWYKKVSDLFFNKGNYWYRPEHNIGVGSIPVYNQETRPSTPLLENDSIREEKRINRFDLHPKLIHPYYRSEPKGTVGRNWRRAFITKFAVNLLNPYTKIFVFVLFAVNICIACVGFTKLSQGLEMKDLSPDDSYLKVYDQLFESYLNENDLPVEVFFHKPTPWWDPRAIKSLRMFVEKVNGERANVRS